MGIGVFLKSYTAELPLMIDW